MLLLQKRSGRRSAWLRRFLIFFWIQNLLYIISSNPPISISVTLKILDKYIFFKFLKTFAFVVIILIAVICVIDYTEKSDDFLEHDLSFNTIFFEYYLNYIPFMANTLNPICVFITTVFMTARMASHTEIVAMMSSGMKPYGPS